MHRLWLLLAVLGCADVTAPEPPETALRVCLASDTQAYFHGDFDRNGVPDSVTITEWWCW